MKGRAKSKAKGRAAARGAQRKPAKAPAAPSFYVRVWRIVRKIPRGRVMTYGQIATLLGSPRAARAVGYAMFNVNDADIPWQRVINSKGEISIGGHLHRPDLQRQLLDAEGVTFTADDRVDLARHGHGPGAAPKRRSAKSRA